MAKHILSIIAFMVVSFGVQGLNHFVINKSHYAAIPFAREAPILPMGLLAMIIQGGIITLIMARISRANTHKRDGFVVSLAFGLFLAAYVVLAEPAKYEAPSLSSWVITEALASGFQFTIFGLCLGLIHKTAFRDNNTRTRIEV